MKDYRKRGKIASTLLLIIGIITTFLAFISLIIIIIEKDFGIISAFIAFVFLSIFCYIVSWILKNKPEKLFPTLKNTTDKHLIHYKAEWFYDDVYHEYCIKNNVPKVKDEKEIQKIWQYSLNKLSVFLTWLIDKDLFIFEYDDEEKEAQKLKRRDITANEFLTNIGLSFSNDCIKENAVNFVNDYFYFGTHEYGNYEEDYEKFIKNQLHKDVNEIVFSWEEYEQFKLVLDEAYDNYKKQIIKP